MDNSSPPMPSIFSDASFQGLGVSVRSKSFSFDASLPTPDLEHGLDILHRETLAFLLSLLIASILFPHRPVSFHVDNQKLLATLVRNRGSGLLHQVFAARRYQVSTHSAVHFIASACNSAWAYI
jgi:hypothetical protein